MSTGGDPEIGYAQQEEVVRELSRHHTDGRLQAEEFDDRVRRARAATSPGELTALVADLPGPDSGGGQADTAGTGPAEATGRLRAPDPTWQYPDASGHPAAGPLPDGSPTTAGQAAGGFPPYQPGAHYPTGDQYPTGGPYGEPYAQAYPPEYGGPPPYPGAPGGLYGASYPPHPGPPVYGPYGFDPSAPFGREIYSGRPYSDKQKIVAGLLQVFLPFGIGRFYTGHTGMAVAQLLVTFLTFGLGAIWSFIDGVVILAGSPLDPQGRPLRP